MDVEFKVIDCSENDCPVSNCGCVLEVVKNRIFEPKKYFVAKYCYWFGNYNMTFLLCYGCSENLKLVQNIVNNLHKTQPWYNDILNNLKDNTMLKKYLSFSYGGCVNEHELFCEEIPDHLLPYNYLTALGISAYTIFPTNYNHFRFFKKIINIFNSYNNYPRNRCEQKLCYVMGNCCKKEFTLFSIKCSSSNYKL
jgi:hypothetical protein